MAIKTKNPQRPKKFSDPLKGLEEKIKIYVWKIHTLQETQAELEREVASLKNENYQLKKELEKLKGAKGP